ncbi:MAG: VCBS repeat-containing protein [Myxococcales bacterium]|nr:VCBS repeat-containing protein [Myxococcales bacterium]
MSFDHRIAISLGLVACGGAQKRAPEPAAAAPTPKPVSAVETGPRLMLGWYCPESAAGRPGVEPALARDPSWTEAEDVLSRAVGARRVKRFSVLGYAGQRAGSFAVAGAATSNGASLAIGSYLGASPCEEVDSLGKIRSRDEHCVQTSHNCSLAVAPLEAAGGFQARPYEEDPDTLVLSTGVACEIGKHLVVDVDGDGTAERFSLEQLIAGKNPVELPFLEEGGRTCEMHYASVSTSLGGLTRVGVLDFDEDGRPEVVYRRGTELFVYGAPHSPARMELLGRATLTSAPE